MNEYNDYVQTTRRYLKNYHQFRITADNMRDDIQFLQQIQDTDISAPISKYGDQPNGGMPELNSVESSAERRIAREKEIKEKQISVESIEQTLRKVDRALNGLSDSDYNLIHGHYIDGKEWSKIAEEQYISEKWARERAGKAIRQMAGMIFGLKANIQLRFNFL